MLELVKSAELRLTPSPLQEIVGICGQAEASVSFALALAAQTRWERREERSRQIVWVRQDEAARESGDPYGPGLAAFGIDAGSLIVVRTRTFADTLRAALEAVRCSAVEVALIETVAPVDLTASRRLKLAAEKSHVVPILIRNSDTQVSNAATVRWRVSSAPRSEGNVSGSWLSVQHAAFDVMLIKHPAGLAGRRWLVEWDHERRQFRETLSLPVAAVSRGRSLAA